MNIRKKKAHSQSLADSDRKRSMIKHCEGLHRWSFLTVLAISYSLVHLSVAEAQSLGWPGNTLNGVPCFGQRHDYGPFDYTTRKDKLDIVERYHFTPEVEQLIRGESSSITGDIAYTLRSFPNHHRALWAGSRYYLGRIDKVGLEKLKRAEHMRKGGAPPECYFIRAKAFAPQDGMVPAIYGIYLHKRGMLDAALSEYREAEAKMPDYSELIYNMGLLYFDLNEFDKAREYAQRAKNLGYPLSGLSTKLKSVKAENSADSGK